jgi:succinate-semialdehyde dehydrogenase/glutarate-semialdehyde dehydrogenase
MAVKGAIASKYRNAGQTCVSANRILVQDGVYDAFTKRLAETAGAMKVADGFEPGAVIGPLIDMKAVEKVEAHIVDAVKKGAKVVTGGKRAAQGGSFVEPTVLTDVTTDMVITKEETFGPVAPLYRFKSEDEAVKMANDTEFGLASYFYSRDIGRIWRVAEALEYGIVGINEGIISTEIAPFGGMKESGIGREGVRDDTGYPGKLLLGGGACYGCSSRDKLRRAKIFRLINKMNFFTRSLSVKRLFLRSAG